jgi:hypothetical protein
MSRSTPWVEMPAELHLRRRLQIEPDLDQDGGPFAATGKSEVCDTKVRYKFPVIGFSLNEISASDGVVALPIHIP